MIRHGTIGYRVATAQGKQGIWLSFFPDGENSEFEEFNKNGEIGQGKESG